MIRCTNAGAVLKNTRKRAFGCFPKTSPRLACQAQPCGSHSTILDLHIQRKAQTGSFAKRMERSFSKPICKLACEWVCKNAASPACRAHPVSFLHFRVISCISWLNKEVEVFLR
ncbi:MAG: hypothetical protein EBU49_07370 [Proteobacteria bacterium]|nr:hypothetical protein [Pseudomonadota bacterium]